MLTRRSLSFLFATLPFAAYAQAKKQGVTPPSTPAKPLTKFNPQEITVKAEMLAKAPFKAAPKITHEELKALSFDKYRELRFKPEQALMKNTPYRLQFFHTGFIYHEPVKINLIKDGIAQGVPYQNTMFERGKNTFQKPLGDAGFAGFRVHFTLNDPNRFDELISFLGASYFRFLGRDQAYGLSARGLAINSGEKEKEEFPVFKEFWIEQGSSASLTVYALMDSASITGAYRFTLYPADKTVIDIEATLFPRVDLQKIGIAPLTSMFMKAENDNRLSGDYRPELHDSDGLLIHGATGEWLWRPLRNPLAPDTSVFSDKAVKGFGLMQRDRTFEHYQDLDLNYENRPSYFVEPIEGFGEGRVELVELPTPDETNDNIVAYFVPSQKIEANKKYVFKYRITSLKDEEKLHTGGKAINTYQTKAANLGEAVKPNTTRFIIDFAGGDLAFYHKSVEGIEIVPSVNDAKIIRTFVVANPKTKGFRAAIDVEGESGKTANLRAFLRYKSQALTETWTYVWKV